MSGFTLFRAACRGNEKNCLYQEQVGVTDTVSLRRACVHDYVCASYRDGYRSNNNFLAADCVPMDLDNDHSDDPVDWIRPEDVLSFFPGVTCGIHYSRHHMFEKDGKSARPRFHVIFLCDETKSTEAYCELKQRLQRVFPYFDDNALDAGRFLFGTRTADCEFHEGSITINECLDRYYPEEACSEDAFEALCMTEYTIPRGQRNATLSRFAGRVLKRLGNNPEAERVFLEQAEKCEPPLAAKELEHIWKSALSFYARIAQQEGYIDPGSYDANGRMFDPEDRTDVGQAELFLKRYGWRIRYSDKLGSLCYNDVCWQESEQKALSAVQQLTCEQLTEATQEMENTWQECVRLGVDQMLRQMPRKKAESGMDLQQMRAYEAWRSAEAYYNWAENRRASKHIMGTMQQIKPMSSVEVGELDRDYMFLNCPDKTYDLRFGCEVSHEHTAKDLCTKVTAVSPGDEGRDLWENALKTIFCDDAELIEYVQQICGLASIGKVFYEAMIIAYGDGRNGKSTFWNTIYRVLGSYAKTISAETLTTGCKRNTMPEIAELKGCRLVLASELKEGTSLNTSVVKQLTSTDPVHAEKKYFPPFDFMPTHTLVLYTNHLPKVRGLDKGIWRRLIVVPFSACIEGKSDIKNYCDHLVENAGGAVLKWLMEGARKVIQNGYSIQIPGCVKDAISAYKESNDWLGQFLEDCCEVGKQYEEKSGDLYTSYRAYCASTGEYTRSTTDFYGALELAGMKRKIRNTGKFIMGLRLKTGFTVEEPEFLK